MNHIEINSDVDLSLRTLLALRKIRGIYFPIMGRYLVAGWGLIYEQAYKGRISLRDIT